MPKCSSLAVLVGVMLTVPGIGLSGENAAVSAGKHGESKTTIPRYHQAGRAITVDKLMGTTIKSSGGQVVGTVDNIVVDKQGKITHLIINATDDINGSRLIPIPWQVVEVPRSFIMKPGENPLVLRVTKQAVNGAPTIQGRSFPLPHGASSLALSNSYFRTRLNSKNGGHTAADPNN